MKHQVPDFQHTLLFDIIYPYKQASAIDSNQIGSNFKIIKQIRVEYTVQVRFRSFSRQILTTFNLQYKMLVGKFIRLVSKKDTQAFLRKNYFNFYNQVPKFDTSKDYYSILQVGKSANESQIKKSYYRLAKSYHPDTNPGKQAKFKEISEAYSVLSDSQLRKQYDSAVLYAGFTRKMGEKARQGTYNYQEYRSMYSDLSPEKQAELLSQTKRKIRKFLLYSLLFLLLVPIVARRNHRFFVLDNGELVPVEFQGGMAGGVLPPPGMMPYGQAPFPGGQPGNSYPYQGMQPKPQQGYNSPYSQQGYNSSYAQPKQPYPDPYFQQVAQNVNPNFPPPTYSRQSNLQPGYSGPVPPN